MTFVRLFLTNFEVKFDLGFIEAHWFYVNDRHRRTKRRNKDCVKISSSKPIYFNYVTVDSWHHSSSDTPTERRSNERRRQKSINKATEMHLIFSFWHCFSSASSSFVRLFITHTAHVHRVESTNKFKSREWKKQQQQHSDDTKSNR